MSSTPISQYTKITARHIYACGCGSTEFTFNIDLTHTSKPDKSIYKDPPTYYKATFTYRRRWMGDSGPQEKSWDGHCIYLDIVPGSGAGEIKGENNSNIHAYLLFQEDLVFEIVSYPKLRFIPEHTLQLQKFMCSNSGDPTDPNGIVVVTPADAPVDEEIQKFVDTQINGRELFITYE